MSPSATDGPLAIVLMSTADWDNPYWTNKQHVAVQLAKLGHRVLYVESLGLRRPSATGKDVKRIWRRLRRGLRAPRQVRDRLWVWSPLVIPLHGSAVARWLNRRIFRITLELWSRRLGLRPSLLWTYVPTTTDLLDIAGFGLLVYHAVDDVAAQPGVAKDYVAAKEHDLVRRADLVFVTAPNLLAVHKAANPQTFYFSNVADFDHFATALSPDLDLPDDLARIPGPRIGFVGAISSYKLDFDLLRQLAARHAEWSIVMVGEVGEGDPATSIADLQALPNIHILGGRPYKQLPAYLKGFDVVLLPNLINRYTTSMFPMKFFEYLAAGKPVVSTPLPALAEYSHVARFCAGLDAFEAAITEALTHRPPIDDLHAASRTQTYEARTGKMIEHIKGALLSGRAARGA